MDHQGPAPLADGQAFPIGLVVLPTQALVSSPIPFVLPWLNFGWHF